MTQALKLGAALAAALGLAAPAAQAEDVTLQLKWVTQAQFAGYYVAADKGFYEEEGLDVEILPGGPDVAPVQVLAGGGADVMVDWMPSALSSIPTSLPSSSPASRPSELNSPTSDHSPLGMVISPRLFGRDLYADDGVLARSAATLSR